MRDWACLNLVLGAYLLSAVGCSSKCKLPTDCAPGELCANGTCIPRMRLPPRSGFDGGGFVVFDASSTSSIADASTDAGVDGGFDAAFDAGMDAAFDGGVDAGAFDGSFGDLGIDGGGLGGFGLVQISEVFVSQNTREVTARGEFVDRSNAAFQTLENSFPIPNNGVCELFVAKRTSGTLGGFSAQRIEIESLFLNGMPDQTLTLNETTTGVFEPGSPIFPGVFTGTLQPIEFSVIGGTNNGDIGSFSTTVSVPWPMNNPSPAPEIPLNVALALPTFFWAGGVTSDSVTIELFDAAREVVMTCRLPINLLQFTFPEAPVSIRQEWLNQGPTGLKFLEIRFDREVRTDLRRAGLPASDTISTVFRASTGIRYTLVP